jgi:hypothetical protein
MSVAKKLLLIAIGYALSVVGGATAVVVHELLALAGVAQNSGDGMMAFGDIILFVVASGFLSLVPTWFLLKLAVKKAPRALLAAQLLIAALGPVSWLAVVYLMDAEVAPLPQAAKELLGVFIVFSAMPRIIAGPVLLVVEGTTFLLVQERVTRALLVSAMLMDLVPLSLFALHLAGAARL